MKKLAPLPAFAVSSTVISAKPIARGWRYSVRPKGKAEVTSYNLKMARALARYYSRRLIEVGPPEAFNHRVQR
jgi:hypothetical protein